MAASEDKFRRLGFIDTTFGVSIGANGAARNFILEFEVFDLKNISEVPALDLKKARLRDSRRAPVWREMIENIKRNGQADRRMTHTLAHFRRASQNRLRRSDGHDKLYRFMESIQEFSTSRASST